MKKSKDQGPIYAYVVNYHGREAYSQFFGPDMLAQKIAEAESIYHGVSRIEAAHAGLPPVWIRQDHPLMT